MARTHALRQRPRLARYGSLKGFYRADPRRIRSRELDVGLWWREQAADPLHRAAWVSDTGELYLVRLGPSDQGGGEVEILARVHDRERLERALQGWRERCGEPHSLTWLRQRTAALTDWPREGEVVRVARLAKDAQAPALALRP
jgi:hypothetical protein